MSQQTQGAVVQTARFPNLVKLLRERAHAKTELAIDMSGAAATDMRDDGELLLVLARVLEGKPAAAAFGAVGGWGYSNPIGKALLADLTP